MPCSKGAIQIIGSSLLGLTLQCAKCHDHKFEPVTQKDYYQLQAILYPAFNVEHWVKPNDRVVIAGPRAEQARWEAHDKAIDAQIESLKRSFASGPECSQERKRPQEPVIEALNARRQPNPGRIAWVGDVSASPAEIPLLVRGDLATPGSESRAGRSGFLDGCRITDTSPSRRIPGSSSTGRRLALARWLTATWHTAGGSSGSRAGQPDLAAPFWNRTGRHIGESRLHGISADPSRVARVPGSGAGALRLERQGPASPDPVLVGLPAIELSKPTGFAASIPITGCWRRFPLRRLDAEAIRDAMLPPRVSWMIGRVGRMSRPIAPARVMLSLTKKSPGATRRSVYLQQRRTQTDSLLEVFDAPSIVTTCTRRSALHDPAAIAQPVELGLCDDTCAEARRAT